MSETTADGPAALIFFRFLGDPTSDIDTVDMVVGRKDLLKYPASLLSKLADDTWKQEENKNAGAEASNPIVTKPLEAPCANNWSTSVLDMVAHFYHHGSEEGLKLPPGIELDDALGVLDYYSLEVSDPSTIDLS